MMKYTSMFYASDDETLKINVIFQKLLIVLTVKFYSLNMILYGIVNNNKVIDLYLTDMVQNIHIGKYDINFVGVTL